MGGKKKSRIESSMLMKLLSPFKSTIKSVLRKLGLLKWVRRRFYAINYAQAIRETNNQKTYSINYQGLSPVFSLSDPYSASFFGYYFKDSIYEEEALKIILRETGDQAIFADVGANIGYFSVMAALQAEKGKVFAFELGDENCKIIRENLKLNRLANVTLEHCAVSDSEGQVFHQDSPVGNAVLKIIETNETNDPDIIPVKSLTLDNYFEKMQVFPGFIKIDVEGAEMKVLKGMKQILVKGPKVLIEIHPRELTEFNSSEQEVCDWLQSFDYSWSVIENGDKKNKLLLAIKQKTKG